jgi:hypothetical protein
MNATLWAAALLTGALVAGPAAAQTNRGGTMNEEQTTTEQRQTDTDVNSSRSSGGVNREDEAPSDRSMKTQESQTKDSSRSTEQGSKSKKSHHKHHRTVKEQKTEKTIDESAPGGQQDTNRSQAPSDVNEGGSVR